MEEAFSERRVLEMLRNLLPHQQLAVGAACCERMLPNYAAFVAEVGWGNFTVLRQALDAIWEVCLHGASAIANVGSVLAECESASPDCDEFVSINVGAAQEAAFCVCVLIEYLDSRSSLQIVRALRFSINTIDQAVQIKENNQWTGPELERRILEDQMMQQELARQKRDLRQASHLVLGDEHALRGFREMLESEHNLTLAS